MKKKKPQKHVPKYMTSLPADLAALKKEIEGYAREFGLDFFDVIYEVLDWNQLNEVAAYGGFPNRYPHWRFGMEYEQLSKSYAYGLSKIYEMVINNDPCYAYLLYSNGLVDQKLVMAHVYAHCDFFKNNVYFAHTNRKMMDEMANHKTRILRYVDDVGRDEVESFIDACLSLDNLIDYHAPAIRRRRPPSRVDEKARREVRRLRADRAYMDKYVNPREFLEEQQKRLEEEQQLERHFPEHPEKDVLLFLLEYAPLEPWERDVLSMIREETYYFAPQGQTKILNEGWACLAPESLVYTDAGLIHVRELVERRTAQFVSDGERRQEVIDWACIPDRKTVRVRTRRGFEIEGSDTHRLLLADGTTWKRCDELQPGDRVRIDGGGDLWPEEPVVLDWEPAHRMTLQEVADDAGVSIWTVLRHRSGSVRSRSAGAIEAALVPYEASAAVVSSAQKNRSGIEVPSEIDEALGSFLGFLVGDGHISKAKRVLGLTTGDEGQAWAFAELTSRLFGVTPRIQRDGVRFRVLISSENLREFLESLGLTTGTSARQKHVPDGILRSPKPVVAAFLRALFDCDGYAGPHGVILSTASTTMSKQVQLLLLHMGILSTRRTQPHDIWHVHVAGASAKVFLEEIGFGLERKQRRLQSYIEDRRWFKREEWTDEIVALEEGRSDVYDITVDRTHRYCAHGFINHNSFWHSKIMTERALTDAEVIDYADHHSGTVAMGPTRINPYKIGLELLRDIEDRWNKGRFGKEYDECQDMVLKKDWDLKLGLGREKIFEVRRLYNDVNFIDTFLTPEFCQEHRLFVYAYNVSSEQFEIASREFEKIKRQFLFQLTNFGSPIINVVDGNHKNRGELLLLHSHEGADLKLDYAHETLKNLHKLWRRPVAIETIVDGVPRILSYDGTEVKDERK